MIIMIYGETSRSCSLACRGLARARERIPIMSSRWNESWSSQFVRRLTGDIGFISNCCAPRLCLLGDAGTFSFGCFYPAIRPLIPRSARLCSALRIDTLLISLKFHLKNETGRNDDLRRPNRQKLRILRPVDIFEFQGTIFIQSML